MEKPSSSSLILIAVAFVVGAAVGYFSLPAKVVTKTEVKTVEKIVTVTRKAKDTDKFVVITETVNADGSRTKRTEIVDKSKIIEGSTTARDTHTDSKSEKTVEYSKNAWFLRAMAGVTIGGGVPTRYGVGFDRRFIGPIYVGAYGMSDKSMGVSVGLSF